MDPLHLDIDTIIPIGLIVNELITNAMKYAFAENHRGFIKISLKDYEDHLEIKVSDSGKGLPEGFKIDEINSLGFRLVRTFSDKLNADVYIEESNRGTSIKLLIPLKKAS